LLAERGQAQVPCTESSQQIWPRITCPVIGALFKNGDLVPDSCGRVSRQQTLDALVRVGVSLNTAEETTFGNFMHLPEPQIINIFEMDLLMPHNASGFLSLEHDFSTGIRDGDSPNVAKYAEFEAFMTTDGAPGWTTRDVDAAIDHFGDPTISNDIGSGPGSLEAIQVMLTEFGEQSFLSAAEMKGLFLNSDYPSGFMARRDTRLQVCQPCAWPVGSTGACRYLDANGVVKCEEPNWLGADACPLNVLLCSATERLPSRIMDVCASNCDIGTVSGSSCRYALPNDRAVRCEADQAGTPCQSGTRFCPARLRMLASDLNATVLV